MDAEPTRILFEKYPGLRETLPHVALGTLPTPVQRLDALEETLGPNAPRLYVKRDDRSGALYGGNKVRKLEFLLAHALREGYREVLTFGGAGSNHALATALYAKELGLRGISMLVPQPNAHSVRRNLLMELRAGAEVHLHAGILTTAAATLLDLFRRRFRTGRFPYLIPPGGSSARGLIGFVNAGLELARQVEEGLLPPPDHVYAASGTMGTVTGLTLGLQAAGLHDTQVAAVRVTDAQFNSVRIARRLFQKTNTLLRDADPAFPRFDFPYDRFSIRHEFFGEEYGLYTPEAMRAVRMFRDATGINLEGTYTGKTLAALLADTEAGTLANKTVVFWNTYHSAGVQDAVNGLDYHALPKPFHRYFEEDVQPLDQ